MNIVKVLDIIAYIICTLVVAICLIVCSPIFIILSPIALIFWSINRVLEKEKDNEQIY